MVKLQKVSNLFKVRKWSHKGLCFDVAKNFSDGIELPSKIIISLGILKFERIDSN